MIRKFVDRFFSKGDEVNKHEVNRDEVQSECNHVDMHGAWANRASTRAKPRDETT